MKVIDQFIELAFDERTTTTYLIESYQDGVWGRKGVRNPYSYLVKMIERIIPRDPVLKKKQSQKALFKSML